MLKRNPNIAFSGVHTFPGGRVEDSDWELAKSHSTAIQAIHGEFYSSAWYPAALVAAFRETKEEAGLVFSR